MMTRLFALAAMLWLFVCVPFFAEGHILLDPSQEYSGERQFWVATVQWIMFLGPPLALWLGFRFFSREGSN